MRAEKQLLLDQVRDRMRESTGFAVMSYEKIDPNLFFTLRSGLREVMGELHIVKKRIFLKAAEEIGLRIDRDALRGHIGMVCSQGDVLDAVKALFAYRKEHKDKVDVPVAYMEGEVCSREQVAEIARLPGKSEMRAQLLGTLTAVPTQTVGVMHGVLASIPHCLEAKVAKANTES
ncbi:MAG: 50S ribosomal protein L10 [Simkaniaceae bacterium]|nr:50S ribosomal protein L10 [Simkaniaceae bacterium]